MVFKWVSLFSLFSVKEKGIVLIPVAGIPADKLITQSPLGYSVF